MSARVSWYQTKSQWSRPLCYNDMEDGQSPIKANSSFWDWRRRCECWSWRQIRRLFLEMKIVSNVCEVLLLWQINKDPARINMTSLGVFVRRLRFVSDCVCDGWCSVTLGYMVICDSSLKLAYKWVSFVCVTSHHYHLSVTVCEKSVGAMWATPFPYLLLLSHDLTTVTRILPDH